MTVATKNKSRTRRQTLPARHARPAWREHAPATKSDGWWARLQKQRPFVILAALLATAVVAGLIWWFWAPVSDMLALVSDQDAVSASLKAYGVMGPLVLAAVQYLQVLVAVIPGHVFLVAGGYVYGLIPGFLMNLLFCVSASQVAFLLARWAGRPFVNRIAPDHLVEKWSAIAEERGLLFFTIVFLLPVFPTDVMNFVAGLTGMSSRKFFIANLFGRLPGVFMLTIIGSHGLELPNYAWAIMGVVVAGFYVAGRLVVGKLEQRYRSQQQQPLPASTD